MHELVLAEQGRILTDEETLVQAGIASSPFVVLSVKAIAPGATDGAVRPEASVLCAEWWLRGAPLSLMAHAWPCRQVPLSPAAHNVSLHARSPAEVWTCHPSPCVLQACTADAYDPPPPPPPPPPPSPPSQTKLTHWPAIDI